MASDRDEIGVLRLSTDDPSDCDSTERFRENFGRAILRIDMEPIRGTPLVADLTLRALADLGIASGYLSPMRNRHGTDLIEDDDIVFVMLQEGAATLDHAGRLTDVKAGDVVITDNGVPATFTGQTETQVINLRFKRKRLAPHVLGLDQVLRFATVPASGPLEFLRHYTLSLNREGALATAELRETVSGHLYDLAALAMGATRDALVSAQYGGLRAARLQAIHDDVLRNIAEIGLTADTVAARHGISPRYIRKLFETEGTSFSDFVLNLRLERAHHMLSDQQRTSKLIRAIASECGFSDLSHFNQTFRRRYGMTPSDVRAKSRSL